jgi:hypothetical protein
LRDQFDNPLDSFSPDTVFRLQGSGTFEFVFHSPDFQPGPVSVAFRAINLQAAQELDLSSQKGVKLAGNLTDREVVAFRYTPTAGQQIYWEAGPTTALELFTKNDGFLQPGSSRVQKILASEEYYGLIVSAYNATSPNPYVVSAIDLSFISR